MTPCPRCHQPRDFLHRCQSCNDAKCLNGLCDNSTGSFYWQCCEACIRRAKANAVKARAIAPAPEPAKKSKPRSSAARAKDEARAVLAEYQTGLFGGH